MAFRDQDRGEMSAVELVGDRPTKGGQTQL